MHVLHHVWLLGIKTSLSAASFFLLVVSSLSQSRQPWGMGNKYSESLSCDGWSLPGSQSNFSLRCSPLDLTLISSSAHRSVSPFCWSHDFHTPVKKCKWVRKSTLTLEKKGYHSQLLGWGGVSQPRKSPDAFPEIILPFPPKTRMRTVSHERCWDHPGSENQAKVGPQFPKQFPKQFSYPQRIDMGRTGFEGKISMRHPWSWPCAVGGEILSRKLDMNTFFEGR